MLNGKATIVLLTNGLIKKHKCKWIRHKYKWVNVFQNQNLQEED